MVRRKTLNEYYDSQPIFIQRSFSRNSTARLALRASDPAARRRLESISSSRPAPDDVRGAGSRGPRRGAKVMLVGTVLAASRRRPGGLLPADKVPCLTSREARSGVSPSRPAQPPSQARKRPTTHSGAAQSRGCSVIVFDGDCYRREEVQHPLAAEPCVAVCAAGVESAHDTQAIPNGRRCPSKKIFSF